MKRKLLTTVFCLFTVCAAFSQISIGVKAGLNLADVQGDDVEDLGIRPSFLAGAYLAVDLSDKFRLQPEVLFVSAGSKGDEFDSSIGRDVEDTYKLNYVAVPVMFMYRVTSFFNIQAGPQISFLASAKNVTKIDGVDDDIETDIKDTLKGTDFGVNAGVGFDFGKFNVSARYSIGLSDINDIEGANSVKNHAIQVALGYRIFGIGE